MVVIRSWPDCGWTTLDLALHAPAAVHDHLAIARLAAQELVVILLEPAFADNVARAQAFVFVFVAFQAASG